MGLWTNIMNKAKKFGKFAWDNRESIGKLVGKGLNMAANSSNPLLSIGANAINSGIKAASKHYSDNNVLKGLVNGIKDDSNGDDFDSLKAAYKKAKADRKQKEQSREQFNQSNRGYSLNPRLNLGTKEGFRVNSWKH